MLKYLLLAPPLFAAPARAWRSPMRPVLTAMAAVASLQTAGCAATAAETASPGAFVAVPSAEEKTLQATAGSTTEDYTGEVRAAAAEFVSAFNGLDQQRFDALWAEDATVFFPQPPFPIRRVDGKAQVVGWFKRFMDAQRSAGKSPEVDPKDLQIQMAGPSSAVVSFHLGSGATAAARRTLVYRRDATGWRIIHLHASALTSKQP